MTGYSGWRTDDDGFAVLRLRRRLLGAGFNHADNRYTHGFDYEIERQCRCRVAGYDKYLGSVLFQITGGFDGIFRNRFHGL